MPKKPTAYHPRPLPTSYNMFSIFTSQEEYCNMFSLIGTVKADLLLLLLVDQPGPKCDDTILDAFQMSCVQWLTKYNQLIRQCLCEDFMLRSR